MLLLRMYSIQNETITIEYNQTHDKIFELFMVKHFIKSCTINDKYFSNCSMYFNKILFSRQICYTFNQLSINELFYDNV